MYTGIDQVLGYTDHMPDGKVILVTNDDKSDPSFVFTYLLTTYAKSNRPIVLINVRQSFGHYKHICNKAGINLETLRSQGRLQSIDCQKMTVEQIDETTVNPMSDLLNLSKESNPFKNLFVLIRKTIQNFDQTEKPLILLDDLTCFVDFGVKLKDICNFVIYCCGLMDNHGAAFVFGGSEIQNDEERERLVALLKHQVDQCMAVKSLATGYSRAVHGEITIETSSEGRTSTKSESYHFHLQDRRVQVFPIGTSPAVL